MLALYLEIKPMMWEHDKISLEKLKKGRCGTCPNLAFIDAKQKSITHGSQVCKESDATTLLVIGVFRRRGGPPQTLSIFPQYSGTSAPHTYIHTMPHNVAKTFTMYLGIYRGSLPNATFGSGKNSH